MINKFLGMPTVISLFQTVGFMDSLIGLHLSPFRELWQDREIRFGCTKKERSLRGGETILGRIDDVEDTRAHNGVAGTLLITNLRLMWWSEKKLGSGLSVGYSCVTRYLLKSSSSKSKGVTESLQVSATHQGRRYEFIFTPLSNTAFQVFSVVAHVYSTYDKTRVYRNVNLGDGESETDRVLDRLASEQVHSRTGSVRNLCGGEDDVGSLFVSNLRVVWSSCSRPCFGISLPFHQIANVKVLASESGSTLVLESSKSSGAYMWNFKVEPEETMDFLFEQITSLWKAHNREPFFGINTQLLAQACAEVMAAEPGAISSQSENVRTMGAGSCGNPEENYLATLSNDPQNSLSRPSADSSTSTARDAASSEVSESELVYWVNPLGLLGLTTEQLEELNVQ
ncbi:hypothetical protein DUNSADRAFT_18716 [Dunaliella salina]|uniref:BBSome complex member BBS5 PH domain-containing protein n=1 Tax=Dunaliella salina TaxID=3046 RepID=A0ABQ7FZL6_DUNSA|nr:hypothetical protein DUNSADRAFT_18716 [Dunaliella salina]|eukprot:KAF5827792.1 hypothetical protein DUNSADRAFT_18716 [Dunaliella salina]